MKLPTVHKIEKIC